MRSFLWFFVLFLLCAMAAQADGPVVSNVRASQRTDGSKTVDVYYDLSGAAGPVGISVVFSDNDGVNFNTMPSPGAISGDVGSNVTNGTNLHIVWNAVLDRPNAHWIQARAKVSASSNPQTTTVMLPGSVPLEMVLIPAGSFTIGSNENPNEQPTHTVTIAQPFLMGKYEVTQAQWQAVMGTNPSINTGNPNRPVDSVSWDDYQGLITALNALGQGTFRLPSEAEWEYACRAGTTTRWYFGDNDELLVDYAWYRGNSLDIVHGVGQKLPNGWGLYDMSGNGGEWCQDWYHDDYNGAPTNGSAWEDPVGTYRVLRGGHWDNSSASCRSAARNYNTPGSLYYGLRLVRTP